MQGRRREYNVDVLDYEPGDYGKRSSRVSADAPWFDAWWVRTPTGAFGRLHHPADGFGQWHEVKEHEDGTISVLPRPGNSNSILINAPPRVGTWHGHIRRGVWEEC